MSFYRCFGQEIQCNHFAKLVQMPFNLGFEGNHRVNPLGNSNELLRKQVIIARWGACEHKQPRPWDFHDFQQNS